VERNAVQRNGERVLHGGIVGDVHGAGLRLGNASSLQRVLKTLRDPGGVVGPSE
jgi:hypothetical protein